MKNRRFNVILAVAVLILVGWMLKGTFSQPGVNDLKAGFKEVTHYRNENNTGPVQYVFIVTVKDTLWTEMEQYGNYKPHMKGGNTKVYFFMEGSSVPAKAYAGKVNFDPAFDSSCIALYEKSAMGNVSLTKQMQKNR